MLIRDTDFLKGCKPFVKGKVRDVYDFEDKLLMIVTDRISAFDVVFPTLIPYKGMVLNLISAFWFDFTKDVIGNHMISVDVNDYPEAVSGYRAELEKRSMLVKKIEMIEAECIVRGYLEGSGLKEYKKTGAVCGINLPEGMVQAQKLPEPIFTPSTKADVGHDENVSYEVLKNKIGAELAAVLRDKSIELYLKASTHAEQKGIILADTKFEFGISDGKVIVADEMFTPDSSRFWELSDYEPGRAQSSFDKQYLREYLEMTGWDKKPPAPELPDEIVNKTVDKYIEAYQRLTGKEFEK
jgi:phosphoribosylaminoimidazole-succinocarboxamide synthase